jgi:alkanesulfonate monooxygenase SsuD/methylene tetrahydromethanopterin reductase-like flavin-dependent oxidoreductase (luciferase family)
LWPITEAKDIRHSPVAQRWMIGTPEQVGPKVEALLKNSPITHFVMGMQIPGVDPRKGTRSMELFAKEIMPGLRKSLGE